MKENKSKINSINTQIRINGTRIDKKKAQIVKLEDDKDNPEINIDEMELEKDKLRDKLDVINNKIVYIKHFKDEFLSDNGFKAYCLQFKIPRLREAVNTMLTEYSLDCNIEIEDDFSFNILKKDKTISYGRHSEGQKLRMNLSIWEALMLVIKETRNVQTNLLIFDEVFNDSMDSEGQEVFTELLQDKIEKDNITGFIIAHSLDNFENNIRVSWKNGFSHYEIIIRGER